MPDSADFQLLQKAAEAGDEELVRELLDQGVDQNTDPGMPRGWPPLMYAAWKGHDAIVQLLLERGALVNYEDGDGFTALTLAAKFRHWAIVEQLARQGGDVTHFDASGTSALTAAERSRKSKLAEFLRTYAKPGAGEDAAADAKRV